MTEWTIRADYDFESQVWYSIKGDVPGLAIDAETIEELQAKAARMLPDLLEIHADLFEPAELAPPHSLRVVAFAATTDVVAP